MMDLDQPARRRQHLLEQIGETGIAILPAAPVAIRNNDVHYPYRQNSDFFYVTAFPEPDAIAVLVPGHEKGSYQLFNLPRDPDAEQWTGERVGQVDACERYGVDQAYPIADFDEVLVTLLRDRRSIYYPFGFDHALEHKLRRCLQQLHRSVRQGVDAPWQMIDITHYIHEMRVFKSPAEIKSLKTAADISARAHCRAMQACAPGKYEYDLLAELQYVFHQAGCLHQAYDAIVGGGKNACVLHYIANQDQLQDGELVLIDAGVEYQYYAADITRTFPINGRFTGIQADLYAIVLAAQVAAIENIKPGVNWKALQTTVASVISQGLIDLGLLTGTVEDCLAQQSYKRFYMHNFGHYLGLDVHDAGAYKVNDQWRDCEVGMVFTVEPGIYISPDPTIDEKYWHIGIRIEDDVVVTESGATVLSDQVPKTIPEIEALMNG